MAAVRAGAGAGGGPGGVVGGDPSDRERCAGDERAAGGRGPGDDGAGRRALGGALAWAAEAVAVRGCPDRRGGLAWDQLSGVHTVVVGAGGLGRCGALDGLLDAAERAAPGQGLLLGGTVAACAGPGAARAAAGGDALAGGGAGGGGRAGVAGGPLGALGVYRSVGFRERLPYHGAVLGDERRRRHAGRLAGADGAGGAVVGAGRARFALAGARHGRARGAGLCEFHDLLARAVPGAGGGGGGVAAGDVASRGVAGVRYEPAGVDGLFGGAGRVARRGVPDRWLSRRGGDARLGARGVRCGAGAGAGIRAHAGRRGGAGLGRGYGKHCGHAAGAERGVSVVWVQRAAVWRGLVRPLAGRAGASGGRRGGCTAGLAGGQCGAGEPILGRVGRSAAGGRLCSMVASTPGLDVSAACAMLAADPSWLGSGVHVPGGDHSGGGEPEHLLRCDADGERCGRSRGAFRALVLLGILACRPGRDVARCGRGPFRRGVLLAGAGRGVTGLAWLGIRRGQCVSQAWRAAARAGHRRAVPDFAACISRAGVALAARRAVAGARGRFAAGGRTVPQASALRGRLHEWPDSGAQGGGVDDISLGARCGLPGRAGPGGAAIDGVRGRQREPLLAAGG